MNAAQIEHLIEGLSILVVDANPYTRKLTRMMLTNIGAKSITEANGSEQALATIRAVNPDVMIADFNSPLDGQQIMRSIRAPGRFAKPNIPVIMLTRHAYRSDVAEAMRLGVHEFLVQPTSAVALRDRLLSILLRPRPMVRLSNHYVPKPRLLLKKTDLLAAALAAYRNGRSFTQTLSSGNFNGPAS